MGEEQVAEPGLNTSAAISRNARLPRLPRELGHHPAQRKPDCRKAGTETEQAGKLSGKFPCQDGNDPQGKAEGDFRTGSGHTDKGHLTPSKVRLRSRLKSKGYVISGHKNVMYFTDHTQRKEKLENKATKLGLTFQPFPDDEVILLPNAI